MGHQNSQGRSDMAGEGGFSNDQGDKARANNVRPALGQSRNTKGPSRAHLGRPATVMTTNNEGNNRPDRYEEYRQNPAVRMSSPRFSRGDRLPAQFSQDQSHVVDDWSSRKLRPPPRGYHWVRDDNNNYFLAALTTGLILDLMLNSR